MHYNGVFMLVHSAAYISDSELPEVVLSKGEEGGHSNREAVSHVLSLLHTSRPVLLTLFLQI